MILPLLSEAPPVGAPLNILSFFSFSSARCSSTPLHPPACHGAPHHRHLRPAPEVAPPRSYSARPAAASPLRRPLHPHRSCTGIFARATPASRPHAAHCKPPSSAPGSARLGWREGGAQYGAQAGMARAAGDRSAPWAPWPALGQVEGGAVAWGKGAGGGGELLRAFGVRLRGGAGERMGGGRRSSSSRGRLPWPEWPGFDVGRVGAGRRPR